MSTHRLNRQKAKNSTKNREYNIYFQYLLEGRWDDDYYLSFNSNYRKYRSWKHNRKTQWKQN